MATPDEYTQAVMAAMGFTLEELELNRNGRLSKRQRKELRRFDWGRATMLKELIVIVFIERPMWMIEALIRRAMSKEVNLAEGVVTISTERSQNTVSVGDHTFYTTRAIVHGFEDGASYRLYYDAHPKTIVSYGVKRHAALLSAEGL